MIKPGEVIGQSQLEINGLTHEHRTLLDHWYAPRTIGDNATSPGWRLAA